MPVLLLTLLMLLPPLLCCLLCLLLSLLLPSAGKSGKAPRGTLLSGTTTGASPGTGFVEPLFL